SRLDHRQAVREHLKPHLRYPENRIQGWVEVRLVLKAGGRLEQGEVLTATDPLLQRLAMEGIRSADPYPAFPPGMEGESADYAFRIRYRLEE
ncbi:MAG: hypothetical protein COV76_05460, partial [Candidatus Omnitrophica bacterium CG11_big_fil_rev_8_21_14_0_20_64_10]